MKVGEQVALPARYGIDYKLAGNGIRQLQRPTMNGVVEATRVGEHGDPVGYVIKSECGGQALMLTNPKAEAKWGGDVLVKDKRRDRWVWKIQDPSAEQTMPGTLMARAATLESWSGNFSFAEEVRDSQGEVSVCGLRPPQIGALFGALAHWRSSDAPGTIVLPTGTGKTETMLALLAHERFDRLLVVVPTDALRGQISSKFETMGLLKQFKVIGPDALYPVVGTIEHEMASVDDVTDFIRRCNVIVTTMAVLQGFSQEAQERVADLCSIMFIDEAHHGAAITWEAFRKLFLKSPGNRVLQFTATPYREDGKLIEGRVVFNYPLRKARDAGYFSKISLVPIYSWLDDEADEEIARAALSRLDEDEKAGFDHVVMARVCGISRAVEIASLYERLAPHRQPILVHSQLSSVLQRQALMGLKGGTVRVVICVDMLGEGFDFPRLKIAAIHDTHKSLAITIQFTGRFTRALSNLGDASVVVNFANQSMRDSLQTLYSEHADWNELLTNKSEAAVSRHVRRVEFIDGFVGEQSIVPLQNIRPRMGAVVYKTNCKAWFPERVIEALPDMAQLFDGPLISNADRMLVFVTEELEWVRWGDTKTVVNTEYHVYMMHWNVELGLLFVNSSNTNNMHANLARAAVGGDAVLVKGDSVFRVLHDIKRLIFLNVGLNHTIGKAVRFSMHSGSDVGNAWSEVSRGTKASSNVFASGYDGGAKVTLGCSRKGRLWSFMTAESLSDWSDWCAAVGQKLTDDSITPSQIMKYALVPETVTARPSKIPLTVEWDEDLLKRPENLVSLEIGLSAVPFYDVELTPSVYKEDGPLLFKLVVDLDGTEFTAEFEAKFSSTGVRYEAVDGAQIFLHAGGIKQLLTEWFNSNPPWIFFIDGSVIKGDELFSPILGEKRVPYSRDRIEQWNWLGTNIKEESQTKARSSTSIQYRVIKELLVTVTPRPFQVVFDDDGSGEAADIIAIRDDVDGLHIHLYHCKFSSELKKGSRVKDLYEVCGQAKRSVKWVSDPEGLFQHLLLREAKRTKNRAPTRFDRGNSRLLQALKNKVRLCSSYFYVYIVQPGLSAGKADLNQLELLASTEAYVQEMFQMKLSVIADS